MKSVRWFGLAMACLAAFLGTPAAAANWIYVDANDDGTVFYYDADTIQRTGNLVTIWEKWDHSRDKTEKKRERRIRSRYNCVERTLALLNMTDYYPDGKNESFTFDESWDPVIPESLGETKLEAVCAATAPQ